MVRRADPGLRVLFSPDAFVQRTGGVSRYVCRLHAELRRLGVRSTMLAGLHWNEYVASGDGAAGVRLPDWSRRRWIMEPVRMANLAATGLALRARPADVFHPTYYTAPCHAGPAPSVITVYDMIHELFPETLPSSERRVAVEKRRWCEQATEIIALSERTKADLVAAYELDPGQVTVVHLGIDAAPAVRAPAPWPRPFLLYVGNRAGYKNFQALLQSLSDTVAAREFDLIVFGGEALSDRERDIAEKGGIRLHRVSGPDRLLSAHYHHAQALIYPSKYEGFGLPPLEAMMHGCPVACSTGGSLPEVVGEAATFFHPTDFHDMAAAIDRVCFDEPLRRQLRLQGEARAAGYPWAKTAEETFAVYRKVIADASGRSSRPAAATGWR